MGIAQLRMAAKGSTTVVVNGRRGLQRRAERPCTQMPPHLQEARRVAPGKANHKAQKPRQMAHKRELLELGPTFSRCTRQVARHVPCVRVRRVHGSALVANCQGVCAWPVAVHRKTGKIQRSEPKANEGLSSSVHMGRKPWRPPRWQPSVFGSRDSNEGSPGPPTSKSTSTWKATSGVGHNIATGRAHESHPVRRGNGMRRIACQCPWMAGPTTAAEKRNEARKINHTVGTQNLALRPDHSTQHTRKRNTAEHADTPRWRFAESWAT